MPNSGAKSLIFSKLNLKNASRWSHFAESCLGFLEVDDEGI
jgi:hypothetical protein